MTQLFIGFFEGKRNNSLSISSIQWGPSTLPFFSDKLFPPPTLGGYDDPDMSTCVHLPTQEGKKKTVLQESTARKITTAQAGMPGWPFRWQK